MPTADAPVTSLLPADGDYPAALRAMLGGTAPALTLMGDAALLQRPLLTLLCSRRCPGRLIVRAYDLAIALRQAGVPVVGAFHGPIERECRDLLLRGTQPLVVCVPRSMWKRPPDAYRPGIDAGRLLLCAPFPDREERITAATAERANRVAVALAVGLFIVHAAPGGATATLCAAARAGGKPLWTLADDTNDALVAMGARAVHPADIPAMHDQLISARRETFGM